MGALRTLVLCAGTLGAGASAHDPGLSSCSVTLHAARTELVLQLGNEDAAVLFIALDRDRDGRLTAAEVAGPAAEACVRATLEHGVAVSGLVVSLAENRDLQVVATLPAARELRLDLRWLESLPRGHREYFVARDADGTLLSEALLRRGSHVVELAARPAVPAETTSFVALGIEHVLTGYDHVLFLLALLLATRRFGSALRIITSFTVAHSVTLALATLQVVRVPGTLVEVVIALSIVWVGIENLAVREPRARWALTFGFGLVHGFGFAGVLQELGIADGPRGVAWPLLEFNAGVELGQLAIALVALPALAWIRRRDAAARWLRVVASSAVVVAGAWWAIERMWF